MRPWVPVPGFAKGNSSERKLRFSILFPISVGINMALKSKALEREGCLKKQEAGGW